VTTDSTQAGPSPITSRAYHITLDDRDSFFALSIEREGSETAYLMSDTVHSLDEMR
jgi:hypothetical protein